VLPGIVGVIQANEALKILVGYGEPLIGRLLMFDAQPTTFRELKLRRDPRCATCGKDAPAWLAYEGGTGTLAAPAPSSNGAAPEAAPASSNGSANGEVASAESPAKGKAKAKSGSSKARSSR